MIVTVEEARKYIGKEGIDNEHLEKKIRAVESAIRAYTNNNFQQRAVQFEAQVISGVIQFRHAYLKVGDNIQISKSVNAGMYTIQELTQNGTIVDLSLYDSVRNLVTKVVYPSAVQDGALNMLKWEYNNRDKVGIKSETISRHSVSYYDQDSSNQVMGYPVSLLGFLEPYMLPAF